MVAASVSEWCTKPPLAHARGHGYVLKLCAAAVGPAGGRAARSTPGPTNPDFYSTTTGDPALQTGGHRSPLQVPVLVTAGSELARAVCQSASKLADLRNPESLGVPSSRGLHVAGRRAFGSVAQMPPGVARATCPCNWPSPVPIVAVRLTALLGQPNNVGHQDLRRLCQNALAPARRRIFSGTSP